MLLPFDSGFDALFGQPPNDLRLYATGDIDNDERDDFIASGVFNYFGNYVDFSYVVNSSLEDGYGLPPTSGFEVSRAVPLRLIPLGNIDQDPNAIADLGAPVLEASPTLAEDGSQMFHQVASVYLGHDGDPADFSLPNLVSVPDLVFEPVRPSYVSAADVDYRTIRPMLLGGLGNVGGSGAIEVGIADSFGGGMSVVSGRQIEPADPIGSDDVEPNEFVFELGTALFAQSQPVPTGVNLSAEPSTMDPPTMTLEEAFSLDGDFLGEMLSRAQNIGDFNDDGVDDLLLDTGPGLDSYVLLGPVNITEQGVVTAHATFRLDAASLGKPASSMGDLDGDGDTDLIMVRRNTSGPPPTSDDITIIYGQKDWDVRVLDDSLIGRQNPFTEELLASRLSMHFPISPNGMQVHAMNFDGDRYADLVTIWPHGIQLLNPDNEPESVVGWVFSGHDLSEELSARVTFSVGGQFGDDPYGLSRARILNDTDRANAALLTDQALGTDFPYVGLTVEDIRSTLAGDINGDGLDDITLYTPRLDVSSFFGVELATRPQFGRVYTLFGREFVPPDSLGHTESVPFVMNQDFDVVIQDFGVGGGLVTALGDLNRDGYDDIGISRDRETMQNASFEIFYGTETPTPMLAGDINNPLSGDITIRRLLPDDVGEMVYLDGTLQALAGDYNNDGAMDLFLGEPTRIVKNALQSVLDEDRQGHLYAFWSIDEMASGGSGSLLLSDAEVRVDGETSLSEFGTLPRQPNLDLNGDRYGDVVVGASQATVFRDGLEYQAGKTYFLYGAPQQYSQGTALFNLDDPSDATGLTNHTVTGSGDFLVRDETGAPFTIVLDSERDQEDLEDGNAWYQFTTIGDGVGGSQIRVIPAAEQAREVFGDTVEALIKDFAPPQLIHTGTEFAIGGGTDDTLVMELDLSDLMPYMAADQQGKIESVNLRLDYTAVHPAIYFNTPSVNAQDSIPFGDEFVFIGRDAQSEAPSLFATDGTAQGTRKIKSFSSSQFPRSLASAGGVFYFQAHEDTTGSELWMSDGTSRGTQIVFDERPDASPSDLVAASDTLYYQASNDRVMQLRPDGTNTHVSLDLGLRSVEELAATNDRVFVAARDNARNWILFTVGNGEFKATKLVTYTPDDFLSNLTVVGDAVFYPAI